LNSLLPACLLVNRLALKVKFMGCSYNYSSLLHQSWKSLA